MDLRFLPKLLLQHDCSPQEVLEDVQGALLAALRQRQVTASVSPSGDGLAVALGQRLVVLRGLSRLSPSMPSSSQYQSQVSNASPSPSPSPSPTRPSGPVASAPAVDFVTAVDAPEAVTALAWLAGGSGARSADEIILAGTSAGFLQLHCAASGALLLRQQLHHSAATSAAVRWSGAGSDPEDLSEDVTVGFADALVRLPAWEVWAAVRLHSSGGGSGGSSGSGWWGGGSGGGGGGGGAAHRPPQQKQLQQPHQQLSFSKFYLPKGTGPRSHAICLGPPPPRLYDALAGRAPPPRVRMLTAGAAPPLAAFEGEEAATQGLLSLVSDLASSTAQSLLGAARSYVPGPRSLLRGLRRGGGGGGGSSAASRAGSAGGGGGSSSSLAGGGGGDPQQGKGQGQGGKPRGEKSEKIPGEPASLVASVWDEKRSITHVALSPCGRLAACCDSLGRVLLVDTVQTLVVRMLKGYRDAQVAWLVVCSTGGGGTGTAAERGASGSGGSLQPLGKHGGPCLQGGGGSASSLEGSSYQGSGADLAALTWQQPQHAGQAGSLAGAEQDVQQQGQGQGQGLLQQAAGGAASSSSAAAGCRHLLVTYAPRRAAVELWEPQTLRRLASVRCSVQAGLLLQQPARRLGSSGGGGAGAHAGRQAGAHAPNRCLLLDAAALTLADLTGPLTAALQ